MAGHSLGEWTGQIASGMIPDEDVDEVLDRLGPGSVEVSGVTYLAMGCGADVAAELVDGVADAYVSHDNCPHQSVVCGTLEAAAQVADRARERKVLAQEMPFRSGFHSPLFAPYVPGLADAFGALPLRTPHTPLWSATTAEPYPDDPDAIRELAVRHLLEPVGFRALVERLHAEGVRVFVQMGVGSLTAFVDDTLRRRALPDPGRGVGQARRHGAAAAGGRRPVGGGGGGRPGPARPGGRGRHDRGDGDGRAPRAGPPPVGPACAWPWAPDW